MSFNLAIGSGAGSSAPEIRVLQSGPTLATLQVTTRADDGAAISVPVVTWNPPAWIERLDAGDEIVAFGRVRRRVFQAGGAAASRTEVEADTLAKSSDRRRVGAVLRRAREALDAFDEAE